MVFGGEKRLNSVFNFFRSNNARGIQPDEQLKKTFHIMEVREVIDFFGLIGAFSGLNSHMAEDLLKTNGPNKLPDSKSLVYASIIQSFFKGFGPLLWIAGIICFLLYEPLGGQNPDPANIVMGVAIFAILFVQTGLIFLQDYSSTRAMKSILGLSSKNARVLRDGKKTKIPATELVVGDVVLLSDGAKVPADLRIFEAKNLAINNSMITGESEPVRILTDKYEADTKVKYSEAKNMAFMTSVVASGSGKGIVVATGKETLISSVIQLTEKKSGQKQTHFQKEINKFSWFIFFISMVTIIILVICWFTWMQSLFPNYTKNLSILFSVSVSVILSYLPLGLTVSLSIVMWLDTRNLKKSQVIVKKLTTVENLSTMNVIASDKTGTLTQNRMHVAEASIGTYRIRLDELTSESVVYSGIHSAVPKFLAICRICNNAEVTRDYRRGNATDIAMHIFSEKYLKFRKIKKSYDVDFEKKFNSTDKFQMVVCKSKNLLAHREIFGYNGSYRPRHLLVKGAPDVMIDKCRYIIDRNGDKVLIDEHERERLRQLQNEWSQMGRRVIMVCERLVSDEEFARLKKSKDDIAKYYMRDLCVIGMLGLVDPPKEGIADTLAKCREAGIRVIMVTGDYSVTAAAIAAEVGIFPKDKNYDTLSLLREKSEGRIGSAPLNNKALNIYTIAMPDLGIVVEPGTSSSQPHQAILLSGSDLEELNKDEWKRVCQDYKEIVIARLTPQHKVLVIKRFQEHGFVIGMTGDGLNDAPALKHADIGIAMGSGNSVALEAADMILLDNSFNYIVDSIENGRLVFDNLKKVVCFYLPASVFCQIVSTIMNMFLGTPVIISSFQLIVVGFVTDLITSVSFIFEKKEENLLSRKPRSSKDHLVTPMLLIQGLGFVGLQLVVFQMLSFFLYLYTNSSIGLENFFFLFDKWQDGYLDLSSHQLNELLSGAQTAGFIAIVSTQCLGSVLSLRTRRKSLLSTFPLFKESRNLRLFLCVGLSYLVMLGTIFIPGLSHLNNTKPISYIFFILPLGYSLWLLLADELRKFLVRCRIIPSCFAW